jgi:serine/threonine-protein kinase
MALQREPARRYATAAALAEDLERWLEHRPVLAQPASWPDQTRKFVRRHRVLVFGGASIAAAVLAGAGLALWQARVAQAEQQRAQAVKQFMVSMFQAVDPNLAGTARSTSAVEILADAERRLGQQLKDQPALRVEVGVDIVHSYLGLHEYRRALDLSERALADPAAREAGAALARVDLLLSQALARKQLGDLDAASQVLAALPPLPAQAPGRAALMARALMLQAAIAHQRGQWQPALALAEQALAALPDGGPPSPERAEAWVLAARAHSMLRQKEASVHSAELALREQLALHGDDRLHPQVLMASQIYGSALSDTGDFTRALPLLRDAAQGARAVYGPDSPLLIESSAWWATVELDLGHPQQALALFQEADRIARLRQVPDPMQRAGPLRGMARVHIRERRYAEAQRLLDEASRLLEPGGPPPVRRILAADRAWVRAFLVAPAPAMHALQGIADEMAAGDARYRGHLPLHYLGALQRLVAQPSLAVATLEAALVPARPSGRTTELAELLIELAQARLDQGDAAAARRDLDEGRRLLPAGGERMPSQADAALVAGRLALVERHLPEALAAFGEADAYWHGADAASRWAAEAAAWLARAQAAAGQHDAARETAARAARGLRASPFPNDARLLAELRR